MADLFWPGDERAAPAFDAGRLPRDAWSRSRRSGCARSSRPGSLRRRPTRDLHGLVTRARPRARSPRRAEASGNPVVPLVALLRERLPSAPRGRPLAAPRADQPGRARHRAGAACARDHRAAARATSTAQVAALVAARRPAPRRPDGRPHADPARRADHLRAQGRAVAPGRARRPRRPARAALPGPGRRCRRHPRRRRPSSPATPTPRSSWSPRRLGILRLDNAPPWHTTRTPFTRYADALVRATDAMGHIANDVLAARATRDRRARRAGRPTGAAAPRRCRRRPTRCCRC